MTKLLRDLPVGALVVEKNTKYNGSPITWKIADKNHREYPKNTVTLMSDRVLLNRKFSDYVGYDNSEIRRWINNPDGLMKEFSVEFEDIIVDSQIISENKVLNDKMFLASITEVGSSSIGALKEGYAFPIFEDNNSRIAKNLSGSNDTWWLRTENGPSQHAVFYDGRATAYSSPEELRGVRPFCNVRDDAMVKDEPIDGVYEIIWNQPPSKPSSFNLPEKVISRSETEISWTKSTDPEGDPISYRLERSLDGGDFVERYKGSFTRYKDIIEDKGHTSVVYRVTAIDSNGNESESLTSVSIPVSDNTIPIIETASADLGKITAAYSVSYKVVDPDEGQTWKVTEKLDDKVLKTFSASVGTSYTCKMSAGDWQKVLNGKHILKIEVVDSEGGKSFKDISFEKAVTKLDFEMEKSSLEPLDKMPERAIISMGANIPAEASIKVEISNNALDDKPVWQDCTAQVLGNEKIFFSNKEKTAEKWAVNVRVTGDKKTATEVLSVSSIGGFYD